MRNLRVEGTNFTDMWKKFRREVKRAGILAEAKRRSEFSRACDEKRNKMENKLKLSRQRKAGFSANGT